MNFSEKVRIACEYNNSMLIVGLDPDLDKFPKVLKNKSYAIFEFCKSIIDATAPFVCGFKMQIAYFSSYRAEDQLEELCNYILKEYPYLLIILDAKRGDIGNTSEKYAQEAFDRYKVHAVTVNPYMGFDSIKPFLDRKNKGVIVLCKTSNPGGSDFQNLDLYNGKKLYMYIAEIIAKQWNYNKQCCLVVGATYPKEIEQIRKIVGEDVPLLIPGIGAQGGSLQDSVIAGLNHFYSGILINASRSIIYSYMSYDDGIYNWSKYAAIQAEFIRNNINNIINNIHILENFKVNK